MSLVVVAVVIAIAALSPVLGEDTRTPELLGSRVRSLLNR